MIENSKNPSNCCKFCGWEFHPDIIQRISENKDPVVCEFCGIEITVSSIDIKEGFNRENSLNSTNTDGDIEKNKTSMVKNISKRVQPTKYSVSIISGDQNFPRIFKENLTIVISRLIYSYIKEWEQKNNVSVRRVSLEKKILNYFRERISPIMEKRVHEKFLRNLFRINREDFEHWLKLLQEELALDQDYNAHFKVFLTWLIKIVFRLVSDMWEMKNLPKLHATILKDLKSYNFANNLRYKKEMRYVRPEEKIKIKNSGFTLIKNILKNYKHSEISNRINYNFSRLINKRLKISRSVFNDLKTLMNVEEIPHDVYIGNKKKIEIGENEEVYELIGVMLGDGHLGLDGQKVSISLNKVDEEQYVKYICNKLKTVFHDGQPKDSRNSFKMFNHPSKAVELTCYSKNLHYFFVERGLIPGSKVQNQVSAPDYIFKKNNSKIRCIKGLFDTDGNTHVHLDNSQLHLNFENASKPLTEDFKRICDDLDIKTGDVLTSEKKRKGRLETLYSVQIVKKDQVLKFLELIDPEKIKELFRRIYLGTRLLLSTAPRDLINEAKGKIHKWNRKNKQNKLIYTKKNSIFLQGLCEKLFKKYKIKDIHGFQYNGKITDNMVESAMNKALSYAPNQISLKKTNKQISSFPKILRNKLCEFLFERMLTSSTLITSDQFISLIKNEIKRLKFQDIYDATNDPTYKEALVSYFKSLIFLNRYIVHLSKNSYPVIAKQVCDKIEENSNWTQILCYDVVREIINYLIKKYPNHLDNSQIEFNKIINYLKIHKKATKQEISKIIGKGFRATYNKLIELEKKGIVMRNREKIGAPTYWSLTS